MQPLPITSFSNAALGIILVLFCWFCCAERVQAQSVIVLDNCDFSYIDPQDENTDPDHPRDTLTYTTYFDELNVLREYNIDINAFGGQQVDRAKVFAIMPDSSRKELGNLAFGNCITCVNGFALVVDDSLLVQNVTSSDEMDLWLQSLNQPPFQLTGNLQTLNGVGRISGKLPLCAIGLYVEYSVYGNPANTTTEFSTHILCPRILSNCTITKNARVDCQKDSIFLEAILPTECFPEPVEVSWRNNNGGFIPARSGGLSLAGNEGWYYLTIEDECCTIIDSILVENPIFAEAGENVDACVGDDVRLQGRGVLNSFWELAEGGTVQDSVIEITAVQASQSGRYIFHTFNAEGCEDTDTLQMIVHTPPEPEIMVSNACLGDSLFLTVGNAGVYAELQWFDPQGEPLVPPILSDLQLADFGEYSLKATDEFGCSIKEIFPVSGNQPPEFEYIIEESCDSSRIYLFPEIYQYEWPDSTMGTTFATDSGGLFIITITDSVGCTSIGQIEVPPPDGPDVELALTHPDCPNDPDGEIEILVENDTKPLIFSIDGGETYSLSTRFRKLWPGMYDVVIQDDLGCLKELTAEIIQPDTIGVKLNYDRLDVRPTTPVSLSAQTVGNVHTFQWLPRGIDTGNSRTDFIATRDMDIRIIVQDERGCLASAGFPLTIVLGDIYVPNAFSPDDDGENDGFTFYSDLGSGEIIEVLRIFDRWGNLLFETTDIDLNQYELGWDGEFNGKTLQPGVYVYDGVVRFGNGERKRYKGDVTLVR